MRAVEYLKGWILHGFEIRIGAQEWKTGQASTSGNADHVCILLFYLLLSRTFSPHKQDCIIQRGGKDQVLPFLTLPLSRFRWYLKGRSSGRDVFLQSAISGVCGLSMTPGPADCHQQFDPSWACPTCILHPTSVSVAASWSSCGDGLSPSAVPALPFAAVASESPGRSQVPLPAGQVCRAVFGMGASSWASVHAPEMGTASPVPAAHVSCSWTPAGTAYSVFSQLLVVIVWYRPWRQRVCGF